MPPCSCQGSLTLPCVQVRERLQDTADKIGPIAYDGNGRNNYFGYGKVNAYRALTPDLDPPANLQASDGTYTNMVYLTWSGEPGAFGYDIYRATSISGTKTLIKGWHTDTSYSDTTAIPNTQYYYWVKAVNERVESDFSAYNAGLRAPVHVYPGGSIQSAVTNGAESDMIIVHQGTYTEHIDMTQVPMTITSTDPNNPAVVAATIVNGNQAGSVFIFDNGEGSNTVLKGLTIQNGSASNGGGIYCLGSSPTIIKCTIQGNYADNSGGGIYCNQSSPTLTACLITGNTSVSCGGGIYCYNQSSPVITGCTLSNNQSQYGGGILCYQNSSPAITASAFSANHASNGGGIYCYQASPAITDCTMTGHTGGSYGGGMYIAGSSPSITGCTITDNSVTGNGGGIYCSNTSYPVITHTTIAGNSAPHGGGLCSSYSSPTITHCTIIENSATTQGGGIKCNYNSPTITNSIIAKNSAPVGGGIYLLRSSALSKIINCTIADNSASTYGAGIYFNYCSPTITNCIIWNNLNQEIYKTTGSNPVITYSDIRGGYGDPVTTHNINADPLFVNPGLNNYRLQINSPCCNTATGTGAPATDRDDTKRPLWGGYDMGAYEFNSGVIHVSQGGSGIQAAINTALNWGVIIVHPGSYYESIDFGGKTILLMSTNPDDPNVVADTIIDANRLNSVVIFDQAEGSNATLTGFTLRNGRASLVSIFWWWNLL